MMPNLYIPVCALFVSLFTFFMFYAKESIKNVETRVFSGLVITSLINCFLKISIVCIGYLDPGNNFLIILNRLDYIQYLTWTWLFFLYIYNISYNLDSKNRIKSTTVRTITWIINMIALPFILFLPMYVHIDSGYIYSFGPSVNLLYSMCGIYVFLIYIIVILNFKKMSSKKYLPVYVLLIMAVVALVVRRINPGILLIPGIISYINLIMFHTIENPDLKLIRQLEVAKSQADQANKAKTDFLSSMSHEIRTPLNAIVGFSEYIESAKTLEEAKEDATDVVKASQSLLEIVNGILDISKIEAGKIEITNSNYDTHELFDSLVKLARARLGDKKLDFKINIAQDLPPTLYGDKMNMKKVIINLLTNAIKYTEEGYFDFQVHSVNKDDICRLIISVEDTGRGIKKEDLDKLFTKFTRIDEDKNTELEGTGLGLAITKQLVELMGGTIVVQSIYGKGSKFTVSIDQKISKEVVKEDILEQKELDLTGHKVLVVDDNKLNLKVANKILGQYNLDITLIESGNECLELINSGNTFDLILMDDMMPGMRGEEVKDKLKEIPNFNTPIVALTANALTGMREKYMSEGFDDFLSKPIEKNELYRVLSKFISNETPNIEEDIIFIENGN